MDDPGFAIEELLSRTVDSVARVVRRMRRSQHQDGGWGLRIEQSNFWYSAYGLLFLKSAEETLSHESAAEIEPLLRRGAAYLEQHPEDWAPDTLRGRGGMSVYDISLMARCFYRAARPYLRREPALRVYHSLDRLYHAQNKDGGWDATLWGDGVRTPVRVWSEVGATSAALLALAETHDERFQVAMARGIQWLSGTQNPDGSWNDASCRPELPGFQLEGDPSLVKTCQAVQGILAGEALDLPLQPYRDRVERGVGWVLAQAKQLLERQRRVSRWNGRYTSADYEDITATLELLLSLPSGNEASAGNFVSACSPSDLSPYAAWLVQSQRRQADDPEDGGWVLGHTARIGLALAGFYRLVKDGSQPSGRIPWIP